MPQVLRILYPPLIHRTHCLLSSLVLPHGFFHSGPSPLSTRGYLSRSMDLYFYCTVITFGMLVPFNVQFNWQSCYISVDCYYIKCVGSSHESRQESYPYTNVMLKATAAVGKYLISIISIHSQGCKPNINILRTCHTGHMTSLRYFQDGLIVYHTVSLTLGPIRNPHYRQHSTWFMSQSLP